MINWAKRNMSKSGFRPEQFALERLFREYAPNLKTSMEYPIYSTDGRLMAKIDFADITNKIAYRLQSAVSYHNTVIQRRKYENQYEYLVSKGWSVEDITEDSEWYWLWA